MFKNLGNILLKGLLTILPIGLTLYFVYWLGVTTETLLSKPIKLVIENYPEGQTEEMEAANNPEDPGAGTRKVPFSRELWIERDDFMEEPPKKFFRLAPGREVRLRSAYFITCTDVIKDGSGTIVELRATAALDEVRAARRDALIHRIATVRPRRALH